VLVAQPLVHRGQGVRLDHLRDQLPAALQLRPGPAARLRVHQLREPARHPRGPPGPVADQTVPGTDPLRLGRGDVLADRLHVHPQAGRHHRLRSPGMPVLQDLHHIDHLKRSPRHPPRLVCRQPTSSGCAYRGQRTSPPTTEPRPGRRHRGQLPGRELRDRRLGNYVTDPAAR
jgi:hypothetical protein